MKTLASGHRFAIECTNPPIRSRQGPEVPEMRMARSESVSYELSKRPNAAIDGGKVGKS